jgi:cell division protein FtsW
VTPVLRRLGTPQLLLAASLITGAGLLMVWSASAMRAELRFGTSTVYLWRQLGGLAIGLLLAGLAARIPLTSLRKLAPIAWAASLLAIAATLTPLGVEHNGASRWLAIGPLELQPLELAKLGVVLGLAWWLSRAERRMDDWHASLAIPALIAGLPALLLLFQPDFGGAVILLAFAGVLVFVAGARLVHLGVAAAVALPLVALVAVQRSYRMGRISSLLDPWSDPLGQSYQLVQSLISFGAGRLFGVGLGGGQQKLGFLPEAHTDFILSVIGEELGLVGVIGILVAFAVLGLAALGIASRARDSFAMFTALGASLLLWLQAAVNSGVAMGVLPTKGTTLPLVSYGRSSLVCSLIAIGLILNTARPTKRGRSGWR